MSKIFISLVCALFTIQNACAATIMQESKSCKATWEAAQKNNYQQAVKLSDPQKCPMTTSFVTWKKLLDEKIDSSFQEYVTFIDTHPQWPWMAKLRKNAEASITKDTPAQEILQFFNNRSPLTATGIIAFLKSETDADHRLNLLRQAWYNLDFTPDEQKEFLTLAKSHLSPADHKLRLKNLCQNAKTKQAQEMLPLIAKNDRPWAEAKVALLKRTHSPDHILNQHPDPSHDLIFDSIRWHKKGSIDKAAQLLTSFPAHHTTSEDWWQLRSYFARQALNLKNPQLAYNIMSLHPFKSGSNYSDAEWFSGWVALSFLKKPALAKQHLINYQKSASGLNSRAKSEYWLGRVYEALDDRNQAQKHFHKAATYPTTYYGCLAKKHLGLMSPLKRREEHSISQAEWQQFQSHEFVQLARLLSANNLGNEAVCFLYVLGKRLKTYDQKYMLLKVVRQVSPQDTLFTAIDIGFYSSDIFDWHYPRLPLDERIQRQKVDHNLIHAIIRQESGFNHKATSPAGALGMMQLMPRTAQGIAEQNKYNHQKSCLTEEPVYNILLGTHYIKEQLNRFEGHPVLAIAAYNAGPGSVLRWIKEMGHPKDMDEADWVELIPYSETRTYVKAVLANHYIYSNLEN